MHEHTIPESLIEQIRTGKAALVVGAGIGVPSWKQMLERLTKALETRGREGDDAATKDLEKLLHKGSLVRAVAAPRCCKVGSSDPVSPRFGTDCSQKRGTVAGQI